jgi:hypothetical protein
MKTNILLSIICAIFTVSNICAQTYYYTEPATFEVPAGSVNVGKPAPKYYPECTYKCDVDSTCIAVVYNADNVWTYVEMRYRNGQPIEYEIWKKMWDMDPSVASIEYTHWSVARPLCTSIVRGALTDAQKNFLGNTSFQVELILNSQTGRVMEVNFHFLNSGAVSTIPVSVFRKIEVQLLNHSDIWFVPTEFGKSLNRIKINMSMSAQ